MERQIINVLDFNLQSVSQFTFLQRYAKLAALDTLLFNLSRYLLELSMVSYRMLKYTPSNLASSAIYLSLKMTKNPCPWSDLMVKSSLYKEQDIRACAKDMFVLL